MREYVRFVFSAKYGVHAGAIENPAPAQTTTQAMGITINRRCPETMEAQGTTVKDLDYPPMSLLGK